MVNKKLGFITVVICFGYITTLIGLQPRATAARSAAVARLYLQSDALSV